MTRHNLTVYALVDGAPGTAAYRTLDDALSEGVARVTELSEAGSVPELRFENDGPLPVLLVDGEELTGAKQNRILNITILAPAMTGIVVPVSCVEAGRWSWRSPGFRSSGEAFYASGRALKSTAVSRSMYFDRGPRSDQGAVWDHIARKSARMGARSPSAAAEALYRTYGRSLDDHAGAITAVDGQVGAIFAINGRIRGMDLFDAPETLARLLPKLVRSHALDAIDTAVAGDAGAQEPPAALLDDLRRAGVHRYPAVGLGVDLRLQGEGVSGGALEVDGRIVHLCLFRVARDAGADRRAMAPEGRRGGRL